MKKLLTILGIILFLQSCVFVCGAAAGAAAVAVVYDHRSIEKITQDTRIANAAAEKIRMVPDLHDNTHISVNCFNQIVLLTGEATTPEYRQQAEELVKTVPKINRIYNQVSIKGPTSSLSRASDSWITAKIKTQMLATKGLQSGTIKVVTENGTVYLMGIVSHYQANVTVNIARQISGVQKVVKIFQYTD